MNVASTPCAAFVNVNDIPGRIPSRRVVNIASLSGKRVKNANVGYAMSKFAVVALTHSVRRLGWDDGVRARLIRSGDSHNDQYERRHDRGSDGYGE